MTYITTDLEHRRRIVTKWEQRPDWSEREVIEAVAAELEAERQQQAEIDARSAAMGASLDSMFRCGACGADVVGRALCDPCGRVEQAILNERALTKDRRGRVTAWMAKVGR